MTAVLTVTLGGSTYRRTLPDSTGLALHALLRGCQRNAMGITLKLRPDGAENIVALQLGPQTAYALELPDSPSEELRQQALGVNQRLLDDFPKDRTFRITGNDELTV